MSKHIEFQVATRFKVTDMGERLALSTFKFPTAAAAKTYCDQLRALGEQAEVQVVRGGGR